MEKYILVRRRHDGAISAHAASPFDAVRWAARAAGIVLYERGAEPVLSTAQKFGATLGEQPLGTIWGHRSGDDFRILIADYTSDGVAITPGLRVQDNNLKWGLVEAPQFFDDGMLMPGGQYFDHWYYVVRENGHRERFNGERLTTSALSF